MNKVIQICSGCRHEIKGKIYARFFGLYYCTKCAIIIKLTGEDVGEFIVGENKNENLL